MTDFTAGTILILLSVVSADVLIYSQKSHRQLDIDLRDEPASFGQPIPQDGIKAFLVYSAPANACTTIAPPPNVTNFTGKWAVLIQRYDCSFEIKVRMAQNASYDLAIVHNVNSSELERMHASNEIGINIPSIFINSLDGDLLKSSYLYSHGYYIIVDDEASFDINTHLLLPFAIVVAICFITMIGVVVSMIVKCIKDRRRARRHRLPNSSLKKIPTAKFRKGDPYDTCAICLEDYVEGEKLRFLPCSHAYHCKCIDPWLTKNRRVCPVCKRKVFARDERLPPSDSESGSDDDRTPLLRSSQTRGATQGGTFNSANPQTRTCFLPVGLRRHSFSSMSTNSSEQGGQASGPAFPSILCSVNAMCHEECSEDTSSVESDGSGDSSAGDTSRRNLEHSNGSSEAGGAGGNTADVEVYPKTARSPSRNALIGSREEINNERSDVVI